MKFHVHTFREIRITYLVEADSAEEAHQKYLDDQSECSLPEVSREVSDEADNQVLIDPIDDDGDVDYDNSRWVPPLE